MTLLPDLTQRCTEQELMDSPDCDPAQLIETFHQLAVINRWLTPCSGLFKRHFLPRMLADKDRRWSLLDLGAGGGDFAKSIYRACQKRGIDIEITCLDYDPRAIEFARRNCQQYDNIEFKQGNALELSAMDRKWDFVFANHFLHHLSDEQLIETVRQTSKVCSNLFVFSDLCRSYPVYLGYTVVAAAWFRNSFCFHDGRLSIRKGFRRRELRLFLEQAQVETEAKVHWHFPSHFSIVGEMGGE